jgi:hypothetical protein
MPMMALRILLACLLIVPLGNGAAFAGEICHFAGRTDDSGHVAVTTNVAGKDGMNRVDVAMTFTATHMILFHIQYLIEEISTWKSGALQGVAVNSRYLVNNQIVRQQWDAFQRGPDGLRGYRVQGKKLAEFQRKFPGFVQHWSPATFGQPWLRDYRSAPPERRADLDLKTPTLPPELRSPLALAFYWIRWLPAHGQDVPVFLPGFKHERLVNLPLAAVPSSGETSWQARLRYPGLNDAHLSTARATISRDHHLLSLALDLHWSGWSAHALIHQEGCRATPAWDGIGER